MTPKDREKRCVRTIMRERFIRSWAKDKKHNRSEQKTNVRTVNRSSRIDQRHGNRHKKESCSSGSTQQRRCRNKESIRQPPTLHRRPRPVWLFQPQQKVLSHPPLPITTTLMILLVASPTKKVAPSTLAVGLLTTAVPLPGNRSSTRTRRPRKQRPPACFIRASGETSVLDPGPRRVQKRQRCTLESQIQMTKVHVRRTLRGR